MGKFYLWLGKGAVPAMASRCHPKTSSLNSGGRQVGGCSVERMIFPLLEPVGLGGSGRKFSLWDFSLEKSVWRYPELKSRTVPLSKHAHRRPHSETGINNPILQTRTLRLQGANDLLKVI